MGMYSYLGLENTSHCLRYCPYRDDKGKDSWQALPSGLG